MFGANLLQEPCEICDGDDTDGAILFTHRLDEKLRPFGVPGTTADSLLVLLADQGADYRALVSVALPLDEHVFAVVQAAADADAADQEDAVAASAASRAVSRRRFIG